MLAYGRALHRCLLCHLVYISRKDTLSFTEQRKRYALHTNSASNVGYVAYCKEVAKVVAPYIKPGSRVLDFGAGEFHVLSNVLQEMKYDCTPYDPLYEIGVAALQRQYDAIIMCEVIEHLIDVTGDLEKALRALVPGGRLILKTQLYNATTDFSTWWYAADPTHVNFFAAETFRAWAHHLHLRATVVVPDIILIEQ